MMQNGHGNKNGHHGNGGAAATHTTDAATTAAGTPSTNGGMPPPPPTPQYVFVTTPQTAAPKPSKRKVSQKRKAAILLVMLFLFAITTVFMYFFMRTVPKEHVAVTATERLGANVDQAGMGAPSPDQKTQEAIENLRRAIPPERVAQNLTTDQLTSKTVASLTDPKTAADEAAAAAALAAKATAHSATVQTAPTASQVSTDAVITPAASTIKSIIFDGRELAMSPLNNETTTAAASSPSMSSTAAAALRSLNAAYSPTTLRSVVPPVVLPDFGSMLPVTTSGTILTIRQNSFVRMETSYDVERDGWKIAKGTRLIGRVTGSGSDRAFVDVVGFIDPESRKLVPVSGVVVGRDGGDGLPGERKKIDSEKGAILRRMAANGVSILGTLAAGFGGRERVYVFDGQTGRVVNPVAQQVGEMIEQSGPQRSGTYVKVRASTPAFVMITQLPGTTKGISAEEAEKLKASVDQFSDQQLAELLLFGSLEEIERSLPQMRQEQQEMALRYLAEQRKRARR